MSRRFFKSVQGRSRKGKMKNRAKLLRASGWGKRGEKVQNTIALDLCSGMDSTRSGAATRAKVTS